MTPRPYTEDDLVQRTMAEYLEERLGWKSVYAHNREDFGPDSLLGRRTDREVVLTRPLRAALAALNPGLPEGAYDDAVRQLVATDASKSIVAANREKYDLLRDGVSVTFTDADGKPATRRVRVFDFETPENNDFLAVRELRVRGDLYRRRADLVGFVNGLPLLFVECKNIHRNLRVAFEQNYSDYRDTIPHLFHHNAIVLFANGESAKIGSVTSEWGHFHEWKRLAEEEPGAVDMETLLKGVCSRRNFFDLFENFILFDDSAGAVRKILARNHQFLGVNRAVETVRDRKNREGRLGVFWHTQGAGKSYSMAFFTRKVHRKLSGAFTFLILTDRADLDSQIYRTFAGCGIADHDRDPCRAASGAHLRQLLGQHKSHVFSLIQKFHEEVGPDGAYSRRDDVIVMTDEAHRTQYGTLALNLRDALPNASYLGFTGTPLFKEDEITRQVFGEYVSTYDFQRAVEDGATVPLYYESGGDRLGVTTRDLNERIAEKLEELEIEDVDVAQKLERQLGSHYHVLTADRRLDQIARDFTRHASAGWESGKAMFVCVDKVTCGRMHQKIIRRWDERIGQLERKRGRSRDEQEAAAVDRQIEWMRETRIEVVVSEEQGEVDAFRRWDLDIHPHRKLLKEGMELPEAMRRRPEFRNIQRMRVEDAFKAEEHPFRVAIVCAMWLTGFDVPCLSTLYLDKPLKAHALMQAIARANRVHEGKPNGLIVDYCGVLGPLRRALATWAAPSGKAGALPVQPLEEMLAALAEAIQTVRSFLDERGAPLDGVLRETGFERNAAIVACKEAVNDNDEARKRFEVLCREVFRWFRACLRYPQRVQRHRADRDAIHIVYQSLQQDRQQADTGRILRELHRLVDAAVDTRKDVSVAGSGAYDLSGLDFERLKKEFERNRAKRTRIQELKQAVETRLRKLLERNPRRADLQARFDEIVATYNREKDRATIERTFEDLVKLVQELDREESRAVREGLDEESLALFDLLRKDDLSAKEIERVKKAAVGLLAVVKAEVWRVHQWKEKETTRDALRIAIRDFLWDEATGLPAPRYGENDVQTKVDEVFRHVFRVYPVVPSPFYKSDAA
jgi:type I restriction enzyme R subunit